MDIVRELLACLAEEGAEVTQAATKAFRFGIDGVYPDTGIGNLEAIAAEVNDVLAILELLQEHGVQIKNIGDYHAIKNKKDKTLKRMGLPMVVSYNNAEPQQLNLPL